MKKTTKRVLSLAAIAAFYLVPMLALGQFEVDRGMVDSGLSDTSVYDIATNLMRFMLMLITILAIIGFVGAGIMYITSGGNTKQTESAFNWFKYSIIGIIVALIGYIALRLIDSLLRGQVQ